MILSNKFLALGLFGLALVVGACCAAELPTDAPVLATTTIPQKVSIEEPEGGADWFGDDDEGEDEGDDEYDMDLSDNPEEDLAELSAEHSEVKEDCTELAEMIQEAKTNNSTVDPELQQAYDQCEQDLNDIESDMQTLSEELGRDV